MRNRLTSGLLPRFAAAAAMLAALPSVVGAWDEDRVQSQLQPYFGFWAGAYMVNTDDINNVVDANYDGFRPVVPAAGMSFGVAYSRFHVGVNAGYQLLDGGKLDATRMATGKYYSDFYYQVIPVDISLEAALLPNEYPVNFLLGGSVGLGIVGTKHPIAYKDRVENDTVFIRQYYYNDWEYGGALLGTAYVGARINLARRLNLEAQLGWRALKLDGISLGDGWYDARVRESQATPSKPLPVVRTLELEPIDLSGAYFRADIRWTFASQSEKDEDRVSARRREMAERIAMLPPRSSSID